MKYNVCVKPYEGELSAKNAPKTYTIYLDNDLEALIAVCSMNLENGVISLRKKEEYSSYSEEELEALLEDYDTRNPFVFFIENQTEDYFVFDSGEDPEDFNEESDEEEDW